MIIYVGLAPWILADGNYEDFSVGQERKFALEFYGPELASAAEGGAPMMQHRESCLYHARGEVVYSSRKIWVCDFGVLAYCESVPRWGRVGARVEGEIYLGIDHYAYFEYHNELPGIPKLTYRVGIRRILLEETPMMADPHGKVAAISDTSRTSVRELDTTDLPRVRDYQPPRLYRSQEARLCRRPGATLSWNARFWNLGLIPLWVQASVANLAPTQPSRRL